MRAPYQTQRGKGMVIGRDRRVSPYIVQNETQSRQAWARENYRPPLQLIGDNVDPIYEPPEPVADGARIYPASSAVAEVIPGDPLDYMTIEGLQSELFDVNSKLNTAVSNYDHVLHLTTELQSLDDLRADQVLAPLREEIQSFHNLRNELESDIRALRARRQQV